MKNLFILGLTVFLILFLIFLVVGCQKQVEKSSVPAPTNTVTQQPTPTLTQTSTPTSTPSIPPFTPTKTTPTPTSAPAPGVPSSDQTLTLIIKFLNAPVSGAVVVLKGFGEGTWEGPYAAGVTNESGEVIFPAIDHDTWNEIYVSVPHGGVTIKSAFIKKTTGDSPYTALSSKLEGNTAYMDPSDKDDIMQSGKAIIHLAEIVQENNPGYALQPEPALVSVARGGTASITVTLGSIDYEGKVGLGAIRTPGGGFGWYEPSGLRITSEGVDLIQERGDMVGSVRELKTGESIHIPVTVTADSNVAPGIYDILLWTSCWEDFEMGMGWTSNPEISPRSLSGKSRWTMFLVEVTK